MLSKESDTALQKYLDLKLSRVKVIFAGLVDADRGRSIANAGRRSLRARVYKSWT